MCDWRPVFFVTGLVLTLIALVMCVPAAVDAVHDNADWLVFLASAAVTLVVGLALVVGNRVRRLDFSVRQIFLLTAVAWFAVSVVAPLPFIFSGMHMSVTDAVFEAVSGITTTGSTVIRHLDSLPPGILLWRALLQWLGGLAFLLMALFILPALNIGGMQMFRLETIGLGDKSTHRAIKMAMRLVGVYCSLTVLLTLLLSIAGMSRFHALLHAMSSISCGGFSTSDLSVWGWHKPAVDWVVLLGMLLGGAPFVIYLHALDHKWRSILRNTQLRWYLSIFLVASVSIGVWLLMVKGVKPLPSLRHGAFIAASVMTGTGYTTLDYGNWRGFPVVILFFLTFIGGCAGSTAGGIKIFRVQILFASARVHVVRLLQPHAVLLPNYERKPIPDSIRESVLGFLFLFVMSFAILAMCLAMLGLDFMSAISTSVSALANLGPGLSPSVGPLAGYGALPDAAKWLLSAAMLFGRLEMFVVLAVFSSNFWRD